MIIFMVLLFTLSAPLRKYTSPLALRRHHLPSIRIGNKQSFTCLSHLPFVKRRDCRGKYRANPIYAIKGIWILVSVCTLMECIPSWMSITIIDCVRAGTSSYSSQ